VLLGAKQDDTALVAAMAQPFRGAQASEARADDGD
jgi:hypothetical protein